MLISLKKAEPVYWKMRNGELISVDDMDINHLRNALKLTIKNSELRRDNVLYGISTNFIEEEINEIATEAYDDMDYPM